MQITLVQVELDQAIREFIGRQVTVADNMAMTIEWIAGRKEAGFSAIIDIVPKARMSTLANMASQVREAIAEAPKTEMVIRAAPVELEQEQKQEEAPFTESETVTNGQQTYTEITASSLKEDQPEAVDNGNVVAMTTTTEATAPLPAPSRSLFKDLRKPKNSA